MLVVVKVTMWDIEGHRYVGDGFRLVDSLDAAAVFPLCRPAWEAFSRLKGLGNVKEASLVEVMEDVK